ncbi:MFS transporter [Mesorhizobium sp.]|uniref:MFS transporter n=1 Tax=Mesorhizobium sp. TaxID=1871066 RepID=UPI000FE2F30C|nr:MFS transporter [Mesorhizobium sp.]RWB05129.1 MAG: MFS transporter [Mesorhizobium sp.]RWB95163.1 MAG: MFS transporter [Mesorhizobium sp.]RWP29564.1 MAG: MFS transporter [Mesorhizobium sp.]RWQ12499.1 MAG: MFS transporter [Mesorhizobium sp.]
MQSFSAFVVNNVRWLAGAFLLTLVSSFGQTFFIALSNGDIRETFGLSHGEFGGLYMLATLLSAATLPFLGRPLDRYSTVTMAIATMLMLACASIAMGFAGSLPTLLLALYLLRLFGQGMMTQTALTATGRWFAANRGRAVSVVTLGFHVGGALLPFLFVLVAGIVGWRGSWFVCAAFILVVALPLVCALVRKERNPQSEPQPRAQRAVKHWTRAEVLRDPTFYAICLGVLAPAFVGTTIFFHQVYLTELRGWPLQLFAGGFAVLSATTMGFALLAGWLIDRFSAVQLLPLFLLPLALACFAAAYLTAPFAIFVFMALLGISYGFSSTLEGAMWPEIYGTAHLGAIRSVVVAVMVLASAMGPGITGYLIDAGVDYALQLALMGVYSLAAALLMWRVSRKLTRGLSRGWNLSSS